ncbi:membrane protein insertase YidC [bacterium]|nr:membrane protein insertase YidC [bacterium]
MDRNTIIAFLIIGLILLLMPQYYKLINPEQPEGTEPSQQTADTSTGAVSDTTAAEKPLESPDPVAQPEPLQRQTVDPAARDTLPRLPQKTITIETPLYSAEFSTEGASIRSYIIKDTKPYLHEPEQLVQQAYAQRNLVLVARGNRGLLLTEQERFAIDYKSRTMQLREGGSPQSIAFTLPLGQDRWYRETYTFYPDQYGFDVHIESRGLADMTGAASALFTWGGGMAYTEPDTTQELQYTEAAARIGSKTDKMGFKGKKFKEEIPTGNPTWISQRTKYFLTAMVPKEPADGSYFAAWPDTLDLYSKRKAAIVESGLRYNLVSGELDETIQVYIGPLENDLLDKVDPTLDSAMSWGWPIIKPFSQGVFYTLVFLHGFIPNYGVVLLVFAVLVKLLVWPLTHKSHMSMKKMQLLQPKMKEIQEKYKENPQKLQKEMGALMKEHKVNPASGCWPLFLQMPLLYGLFIVFRSTIELRGQPFFLWISDLSQPDVIFQLPFSVPLYGAHVAILPFIMGVTAFLQSKSTSSATDPNQKIMLYFMPVFLVLIFNNFPSGLTLYYTLFNILSWGQTKLMKVSDPALEKDLEQMKKQKEAEAKRLQNREQRRREKEKKKQDEA